MVDIDDLATATLRAMGMWQLPVNPFAIAKEEGLELAPGDYGEKFDARIEFIANARIFILYYKPPGPGRTEGRVFHADKEIM